MVQVLFCVAIAGKLTFRLLVRWCNGNTAPFGGVIHGSNPCRTTNFQTTTSTNIHSTILRVCVVSVASCGCGARAIQKGQKSEFYWQFYWHFGEDINGNQKQRKRSEIVTNSSDGSDGLQENCQIGRGVGQGIGGMQGSAIFPSLQRGRNHLQTAAPDP